MAIPTSFINYTPDANVTKTCPMVGHNAASANIHLIDVAGTATPKMIVLGANISIVMTATYTDEQITTLLQNYLAQLGVKTDGSAGGPKAADAKQITPTHSTCT